MSPIQKSESMMPERKRLTLTNSPQLSTSFLTKSNKSVQKPSKLPVSQPTKTWSNGSAKTVSTWESVLIHSTLSVLTKCFRAPELIDFRPVWEEPSERLTASPPVSALERFFSQSELNPNTSNTLLKLSEEPRTSSPADRRSSFPRNGDSLNSPRLDIMNLRETINSFPMDLTSNSSLNTEPSIWKSISPDTLSQPSEEPPNIIIILRQLETIVKDSVI